MGVLMIVAGAGAQLGLPTVVLTCERGADGATSCVIDRRILFGTFSRSREDVHGVTDARTTQWDNRSKRDDFSVALITDRGELDLGVPGSESRASEVTRAVTALLAGEATRVDAVLRPSLSRQFQGAALLVFVGVGGWLIVQGVRRWHHRPGDHQAESHA